MSKPFAYEDRLLAWVDLLGWTALVDLSASDEAARLLVGKAIDVLEHGAYLQRASEDGARQFGKKYDAGAKYSFVSDTFILSVPANATSAPYFTGGVSDICCKLLDLGLPTRGALVLGKLVHDGNRIYGPIVAQAAGLEKDVAKVPRIVVTVEASACLSQFVTFARDTDGHEYLDVLRPRVLNDPASLEPMLQFAQSKIADPKNGEKYRWLAAYIARSQADVGS